MILERLAEHSRLQPEQTALQDAHGSVSYAQLHAAVTATAAALRECGARTLGVLLDNGPAWVIMDLAALQAGIRSVPLPAFFSPAQIAHTIDDAGIDTLCTDARLTGSWPGFEPLASPLPDTLWLRSGRQQTRDPLPAGTAKVTFTSGSTGSAKGVCLDAEAMLDVADSIVSATAALRIEKHLSLLPLSLLLENICGVYAPLLAGASVILPNAAQRGLQGSRQLDIRQLIECLHEWQPHSLVLVPQLLKALSSAARRGMTLPGSLRFVAVGGARVSPELLTEARQAGIPVYEGYGLSECSSVVALNLPGSDRPGSVGKPLPHAQVRIAADGEIEVRGATLLGYTGQPLLRDAWYPTGDLGFIDEAGFLHLTGRRRNAFITAYGRNVNPEWPESELTRFPEIAHAVVFGEAMESNVAVIQPAAADIQDASLQACIEAANELLPDYARIHEWQRAGTEFSSAEGLLTDSGKPRRDAVWAHYRGRFAGAAQTDAQALQETA